MIGEPASLLADEPAARTVAGAVFEPLVARTALEELEPRLAEEVPTFENGQLEVVAGDGEAERLAATFRLRQGLAWHDGAPITSADVRFALERDRSAPVGSPQRETAERIETVDLIDERSVRVLYRAGERWEGYPLAPRVLPRHLLATATEEDRARYERAPVHAGPYRVSAWVPGSHLVLESFEGYALGPPAIGRIVVRFYADRALLLDAVRRGEVDVAPSPGFEADLARTLDRFGAGSGIVVSYTPSQAMDVLRFGSGVAEPAVRSAIAQAIDRERIVRVVFSGRARVPHTYLVPPLWAATEALALPASDRERARALLALAGYRPGSFGIQQRGTDRLVLTLLTATGSPSRTAAATQVAADLAAVGIAVEVRSLPRAEIEGRLARGEVDLAIVPESSADAAEASERYRGAVEPWFDVLVSAARTAADLGDKRLLYHEAQRLWTERLAALPLYQHLRVDVVPSRLEGVRPPAHGGPLTWNAAEWRRQP